MAKQNGSIYWEVFLDGERKCYGPEETLPDAAARKALRESNYKIYIDGKLSTK